MQDSMNVAGSATQPCRLLDDEAFVPQTQPHVPTRQRGLLIAIVVAIGLTWLLRLNSSDLFNPDSPRYLLYSRALVTGHGYRAIDLPDQPPYTWRPPGVSLLLLPVTAMMGQHVVAAKLVIWLSGLGLLVSLYGLVRFHSSPRWATAIVVAVGLNPNTLLLATEVLSEVPYAACSLAIAGLLTSHSSVPSKRHVLAASLLLGFLPLLRTVGVSLVVAVGLWAIVNRLRWRWLLPAMVGAATVVLWMAYSSRINGHSYADTVAADLNQAGVLATVQRVASNLRFHSHCLLGSLLPGAGPGKAMSSLVLVDEPSIAQVWRMLFAVLATTILSLSLLGMVARLRNGSGVILLYMTMYLATLSVWPWRHERFIWPLMPLVWAFVPAGARRVMVMIREQPAVVVKGLSAGAAGVLIGLLVMYVRTDVGMLVTNIRRQSDPDAFHRDTIPPLAFSDWREAGRWIAGNTPAHARVLTRHASVVGTSHRFQRMVLFETLTAGELRRHIETLPARYLVLSSAQFGDGFDWRVLEHDPVYVFRPVYDRRGVVVMEVLPNRDGTVSRDDGSHTLRQFAECDAAVRQHPKRRDLRTRFANLLAINGRRDDAIRRLEACVADGAVTARLASDLGGLLFEAGRYAEATRYLSLAAELTDVKSLATAFRSRARLAEDRARRPDAESADATFDAAAQRVRTLVLRNNPSQAWRMLEEANMKYSDSAVRASLRGELLLRCGDTASAESELERAVMLGDVDAAKWLTLLRWSQVLASNTESSFNIGSQSFEVNASNPQDYIKLAERYREVGLHGKALTVLEFGHDRCASNPDLPMALAELLQYFGYPEECEPLYAEITNASQFNSAVLRSREATRDLLRKPGY